MDSGLQVREVPESSLPEHYVDHSHKEAYSKAQTEAAPPYRSPYVAHHNASFPHSERRPQRVCGLSPLPFGIVIAAVTALVVGAAIGGGLMGTVKDARQSANRCLAAAPPSVALSDSTTPMLAESATATTTVFLPFDGAATTSVVPSATTTGGLLVNYTVAPQTAVYNTPYPCPDEEGNSYITARSEIFDLSCQSILGGGDLGCILAYTYQDCLKRARA
ncbi:hypothetical protein LTR53_003900 [Teratosphaeriaceae sp. CCFEE 6253]|nr:hypothetical protein LTR53_003900 [Teratosphaeriaceae sp. CCFEE 6253]